ncbi:O-antigen ligase family protein [Halomonas cibimaris]|uniref:O-antigen ligase family protein n=1 Tax=Halomonas cibimaris TaxID=657012 RepID=UPI0031E19534
MALSGFLFDSDWIEFASKYYPVVFLGIGAASLIVMFLWAGRKKNIIEKPFLILGSGIGFFIIIGLSSSIFSGAGNILALGMKISTLIFNLFFAFFSYKIFNDKKRFRIFAKTMAGICFTASIVLIVSGNTSFNLNWVGITTTYSVLFLILSSHKTSFFSNLFFLSLLLFFGFSLGARGVEAAAALCLLYTAFTLLLSRRFEKKINSFIFYLMPAVSLIVAIAGVWLYNSDIYSYLVSLSIENTGKSLDSGRLGRWDLGYRLLLERPFFGWGVDAHISRAGNTQGFGDLHNLWWEFAFRAGVIGLSFFIVLFYYLAYRFSSCALADRAVCAYIIIFIFLSVYALGGVTHWPGAFMFWCLIGILLRISHNNDKQ